MRIPDIGVFSPYTLMLHLEGTGESPVRFLKRASIVFERLLLFPLGLGNMGERDEVISKERYLAGFTREEPSALGDLCKIVMLHRHLIEDPDSFYEELATHETDDLWGGDQGDKYIDFVSRFVNFTVGKEDIRENWEAKKHFIGNINADCKLFKVIQRNFGECSGLFTELHEAAVLATVSRRVAKTDGVITTLSDLNTLDFADLSWADILILRRSEFAKDFRSKLAEWAIDYASASDNTSFQANLNRFVEQAKFDLIGKASPKIRETVLSGIGSILPSPIVVNPIGVFSAIKSIKHDHDLKKRYGWLFFIQRARKVYQSNKANAGDG